MEAELGGTLNPQPQTLNLKPEILHPKPATMMRLTRQHLQGYLAHKTPPPRRTLQQVYA